jgi:hypothetical protein
VRRSIVAEAMADRKAVPLSEAIARSRGHDRSAPD